MPPRRVADRSPVIGHAGIFVADGGGEELEEAAGGFVAGGGDHARRQNAVTRGDSQGFGRRDDGLLIHAGESNTR